MSEVSQPPQDRHSEPTPVNEALGEFLNSYLENPQALAEEEAIRKKATQRVDAANLVRSALEDRRAVIERLQAGEAVTPEAIADTSQNLLEAQLRQQQLQQEEAQASEDPPS